MIKRSFNSLLIFCMFGVRMRKTHKYWLGITVYLPMTTLFVILLYLPSIRHIWSIMFNYALRMAIFHSCVKFISHMAGKSPRNSSIFPARHGLFFDWFSSQPCLITEGYNQYQQQMTMMDMIVTFTYNLIDYQVWVQFYSHWLNLKRYPNHWFMTYTHSIKTKNIYNSNHH